MKIDTDRLIDEFITLNVVPLLTAFNMRLSLHWFRTGLVLLINKPREFDEIIHPCFTTPIGEIFYDPPHRRAGYAGWFYNLVLVSHRVTMHNTESSV